MKRKIYSELLKWKHTAAGKTAILLDGARRVGKSYIAEEFAKAEYASYLIVDFAHVPDKVKRYFREYLTDLDTFFLMLEGVYGVKLVKGNSLIIFDEVQRFPKAREAIKYLVKDGRYHYLETGSLISINRNVRNIVIPSEERHLKMFPMDFEEFLWAMGRETLMPIIERSFREQYPIGTEMNALIVDLFRQYVVVGGMPQAVETFVSTHDLAAVDQVKRDILALYRADIYKFAGKSKAKVLAVWDDIPAQLSQHEKKYTLADVDERGRMRDFDATFEWLKNAMIVNVCYNSTDPNVGLKMNMERTTLKCYMADTGLLVSHAFNENELAAKEVHKRILTDDIELNEGMLIENVVAQMLRAAGHHLYFHSESNREDKDSRMEIDFLIAKSRTERKGNISPIEVKSGKRLSHSSLDKFMRKFSRYVNRPYILYWRDFKESEGIIYLPLYMAPLLVRE